MTIRLSTGLVNKMLDGDVGGGLKGAFTSGYMAIFAGTQPSDADTGSGSTTLLGTVTKNDDGTTVITFAAAAAGVSSKTVAEVWRFHGLAAGTAGWFRMYVTGEAVTGDSTAFARLDGSIGTAGADLNISNTNIILNAVTTVDSFTVTLPKA